MTHAFFFVFFVGRVGYPLSNEMVTTHYGAAATSLVTTGFLQSCLVLERLVPGPAEGTDTQTNRHTDTHKQTEYSFGSECCWESKMFKILGSIILQVLFRITETVQLAQHTQITGEKKILSQTFSWSEGWVGG